MPRGENIEKPEEEPANYQCWYNVKKNIVRYAKLTDIPGFSAIVGNKGTHHIRQCLDVVLLVLL